MNDFHYYENLSVEKLIDDPEFRRWVFSPTIVSDRSWKEFYDTYPEQQEVLIEAKAFLEATKEHFEATDKSPNQVKERLQMALDGAEVETAGHGHGRKEKTGRHLVFRLAVAASFLVVLGLFGWYVMEGSKQMLTYQTKFGEWKKVELPDGSVVHLNANSKLTLTEDWSYENMRKVWLDGEAFFEVVKKPFANSKFQVITGDLIIEVLGTQFNVQNRGPQTEVFLKEGKIKLDMAGHAEYLAPGEFVTYSAKEKSIVTRLQVPQEPYTSWKDGTLEMNTSVEEILEEIEAIYGVNIEVSDTTILKEVRKLGVPMKELETVIPILEISLNGKIIKDGNKLIMK